MSICPDCDGLGRVGLWRGRGGEEYFAGDTETCPFCYGEGEIDE